jgi:transcriptional regulator with XRE-family HTH domain
MITSSQILIDAGKRITNRREAAGLSQVELSLRTRIPQQSISKAETAFHKKLPPLDRLFKIGEFFRLSPETMLFGTEPIPEDMTKLMKAWQKAPHETKMKIMLLLWPQEP